MLKDLKVGTTLFLGFLVLILMGAGVAGIGIYSMSRIDTASELLYKRELLALSHVKSANIEIAYVSRFIRAAVLASTPEERQQAFAKIETYRKSAHDNLDKARPLFVNENGKKKFAELDTELKNYEEVLDGLAQKIDKSELMPSNPVLEYMRTVTAPKVAALDASMDALTKLKEANAKDAADANNTLYTESRLLLLCLVALSTVIGLATGVLITKRLTTQLGGEPAYAASVAERIAEGDLTVDVHVRPGDNNSLLFAMKKMRDSLVQVVYSVRQGTDALATASNQIASGNMDLSARTEQQASSLEETASSMEELTSTVRQNADNAKQANNLALTASTVASKGGAVITDVVTTMGDINTASHKIVDIISVIDGIAFQTNILALNAAVEAARAGEQGRGFAVVASEVRTLAQRSSAAAKEIKALIDDSVNKVASGTALVDQAGATMTEIVSSIQRVNDIMNEISAASAEQTSGIEQVNQAVIQMDSTTQQNAALVEEAAAASSAMKTQTEQLAAIVSVFKLDRQTTPAVSATPSSTPVPAARKKSAPPVARTKARPTAAVELKKAPPKQTTGDDWEEF